KLLDRRTQTRSLDRPIDTQPLGEAQKSSSSSGSSSSSSRSTSSSSLSRSSASSQSSSSNSCSGASSCGLASILALSLLSENERFSRRPWRRLSYIPTKRAHDSQRRIAALRI